MILNRGWPGMQINSHCPEKRKSTRRRKFCVESQRPSKRKKASMHGIEAALSGKLVTE